MSFLPPVPKGPRERQAFIEIWKRELRVFRRRPSFIVGMAMAALSGLSLLWLTSGILPRIAIVIGTFGVASVYDTVTRHFCTVLYHREHSADDETQ